MSYQQQQKPILAKGVNGTVKWFNGQKGYGFITCEGNSEDVFVHVNQIQKYEQFLNEGEYVTFDVVQGRKGGLLMVIGYRLLKWTAETPGGHSLRVS